MLGLLEILVQRVSRMNRVEFFCGIFALELGGNVMLASMLMVERDEIRDEGGLRIRHI
jgi:hypothetical protein